MSYCVFCGLDDKQRFGRCFVFTPLNPVVPGHLLVIHEEHTNDFTSDENITGEVASVAAIVARQIGGEFNLITSKGKSATQSIFHMHMHLVPRTDNDGLHLPWTNQSN